MKFLVVLAVAVASVTAGPGNARDDFSSPVLKNDYEINSDGSFKYAYETANGISADATGVVKDQNSEYPTLEVSGSYRYLSPDGEPVQLAYVADEFGYRPDASHLPVAPPTPEAILRSLAYIAAHPPPADGVVKPVRPPVPAPLFG